MSLRGSGDPRPVAPVPVGGSDDEDERCGAFGALCLKTTAGFRLIVQKGTVNSPIDHP